MKKYKYLFFDLDRTLWDFDENSKETLNEIYHNYNLSHFFSTFNEFYNTYHKQNEILWAQYREGKLKKDILRSLRFYNTLLVAGEKNQKLAHHIGNDYVKISPAKTNLFPYAHETLEYLKSKKYNMYIITNGFNEVQFTKLKNSKLSNFFSKVITSEMAGYHKPDLRMFNYTVTTVNAKKIESIVIGDDFEVDILGAKNAGIDQVYFNPSQKPHNSEITFEIESLKELKDIF